MTVNKAYNRYFKQWLPIDDEPLDNGEVLYLDLITPFAKIVKNMVKGGKDQVFVAYTGHTGSGKSNGAVLNCLAIDKKWDIDDGYIYTAGDFIKKLRKIRDGEKTTRVLLFDEGSVSLNSSNSQRKGDVSMTIAFDTLRSFGMVVYCCIPNLRHLNKRIDENHINFMWKVPVSSPKKGYSVKGFASLYAHAYRDWGQPYWDYVGTSVVKRVPPRIWEHYEEVKRQHQFEFIDSLQGDEI